MGDLHNYWKAEKAKVKKIDTAALFKKNLGKALDKFDDAFDKVEKEALSVDPLPAEKRNEVLDVTYKLINPPLAIVEPYLKLIIKKAGETKAKAAKAKTPAEKKSVEAEKADLKVLLIAASEIKRLVVRRRMELLTKI